MTTVAPDDVPLLLALCIRNQRGVIQKRKDIAAKEEIEARLALTERQLTSFRDSIRALGFESKENGWYGPIREAIGRDKFDEAMENAGLRFYWSDRVPPPPPTSVTLETPEVNIEAQTEDIPPSENSLGADASVRALALERLKIAGSSGAKASEIRAHIENLKGAPLHSKTVGMTLYRLSTDGLAVREGLLWFCVPPDKTMQNPGDGTPGLFNRENKEEDEL